MDNSKERGSKKWGVVGLCFGALAMSSVVRISLGIAAPTLMKEFDISRRHPFTILFSLLLAMLIVASKPSLLIFGFFFLYALSGFLRHLPFVRRRVSLDLGEELELTPGEPRSL